MQKYAALVAGVLIALAVLVSTVTSFASRDGGGGAGVPGGGPFPANLNLQSDVCLHDGFIWGQTNPPPHNVPLQVVTQQGAPGQPDLISIFGPETSPWVAVHGIMEGTNFSAQGTGQVGPNPQASVEMTGTWNGSTLAGTYTMGSGPNDLPLCGQPLTHHPAVYGIKPKPTATPTPTPQKLYSIIVLKQNADNFQPLPGWRINLYVGSGCQGSSTTFLTTNANGLVDFLGLTPGTYSVQEKSQPGWNPTGPVCRDVTVGIAGSPGGIACPIQPDQPFPQPGCDSFLSGARVIVRVNATGEETAVNLNGPTVIRRNNKPVDVNPSNGRDEVQTEIIQLDLTGGGVTVRESPTRASTGRIEEQANVTLGTMDFPADSFFDVFFEVDFAGITLHNEAPFRIACKITEVPPYLCFYQPPVLVGIPLLNADGVKIATLLHGKHIPLPPNESLIIFTNRPKATPTRTPTSAGTPTRTATPRLTATPTLGNPPPNGDCVKTGQNVPFLGAVWAAAWKCTPGAAVHPFNRIDVAIGKATQAQKLSAASFVCQQTGEKAVGMFKGHKKDVNPAPGLPHHEIWSGDFHEKCTGGVTVYLQPVNPAANHPVIKEVAFTNTTQSTPTATPTPANPPPNGDCVKTGQNVLFQGAVWAAAWKCTPGAAVHPFNRIDVAIGTATQAQKLSAASFVCQQTGEKAVGMFKGHKKDVNPAPGLPHHEIWSGDFHEKCTGGVTVYLQTVDPANHAIIQQVAFTNTSGAATPTPTRTATPTPHKPAGDVNDDGAVNSLDALLTLQLVARLLDEGDLLNPASADANGDGDKDSIDALLMLQIDAGLLDLAGMTAGRDTGAGGSPFSTLLW